MKTPFQLTDQELLVGVGAALDEAQLQSGDQYAHEVKLMHLEAGFDWGAPLERQLYLVKNALKRHKGPEVRANECKVEDLSEEVWKKKVRTGVSHAMPAWSYAFACIWMLRAAEAFKIKVMDVEMNEEQRLVRLFIPSSKTDQRGSGVKRTLACKCPGENCSRWCAWCACMWLSYALVAEAKLKQNTNCSSLLMEIETRGKPKWWKHGQGMFMGPSLGTLRGDLELCITPEKEWTWQTSCSWAGGDPQRCSATSRRQCKKCRQIGSSFKRRPRTTRSWRRPWKSPKEVSSWAQKGPNQTNTLIPTAKKRTQMRKRPRRYPESTRKSRTSGRFPETHVAELRMS